jgi:hypothetical protein
MPQNDGFSAWIAIDGVRAPEFDVQAIDRRVTCWIPSEVGKVRMSPFTELLITQGTAEILPQLVESFGSWLDRRTGLGGWPQLRRTDPGPNAAADQHVYERD